MWFFIILASLGGLFGVIAANYCGLPFLLTATSCLLFGGLGGYLAIVLITYVYQNCEIICVEQKTYPIRPYGDTFWYYVDGDELVDYFDENGKIETVELSNIVMVENTDKPQLLIKETRIKNNILHTLLGVGNVYEHVLQIPYH